MWFARFENAIGNQMIEMAAYARRCQSQALA
jgi:hypothetical protein